MQLVRHILYILVLKCLLFNATIQQFLKTNTEKHVTGDIITTTEEIVDDQNKSIVCSPEQSLHTTDDIRAIIDYVFRKKSYDKEIRHSYRTEAEDVHHKHLLNVSEFRKWIENRPIHLKHILEEMTIIRRRYVEPVANKLAIDLQENPLLEEQFRHRLQNTQSLLKTLENYEMICKYNCDNEQGHHVVKRNVQEPWEIVGYYCSSIEALHNEIDNKLSESIDELKNQTNNMIGDLDKKYSEKIETLKNAVKDEALNKFGRTMYSILDLQDEYHHFREFFLQINISEETYSIKDLGLKIDAKLFNLQKAVKQYGDYCRNCNSVKTVSINLLNAVEENDKYHPSVSVVDALIKIKYLETWRWVQEDLKNTFSDLDEIITKTEDVDVYLQNLKQLKEEVILLKDKERAALNNLKSLLPQTSINKLFELVKESHEMLKNIDEGLQKIGMST